MEFYYLVLKITIGEKNLRESIYLDKYCKILLNIYWPFYIVDPNPYWENCVHPKVVDILLHI